MGEPDTDKLLGELFKKNAPHVNEPALCARVAESGQHGRRSRRHVRRVRAVAVAFASVVLALGAAYGVYRVVTHFQGQPLLVLTDSTVPAATPGDTESSDPSTSDPEVQAKVELMTSAPLELTSGDQTWTLAPEEIATYLHYTSESVDGVSSVVPCLSSEKMSPFFARMAGALETAGTDATFESDGTKVWVIPGVDGIAIDADETAEALTAAALRTTGRTTEVVFTAKEPDLTTAEAEAMGVTDLLGNCTTEWNGTTDRQQNVSLTTGYASDVLLAPGQEYDFDQRVGPRTRERGYQPTMGFIVGPGVLTTDRFRGALSQVSTTLFNAAFFAGLEILERHNQPIYIDHYPQGMDAAITDDGDNLRFKNNTGHYIWIVGDSDGITTTFDIYGTDDGRKVSYSVGDFYELVPRTDVTVPVAYLPEGTNTIRNGGQSGKRCEVVRTITWADGSTTTDSFVSIWPMMPRETEVGTGTSTTIAP
jgi:vancomycin resistance protein YoaR